MQDRLTNINQGVVTQAVNDNLIETYAARYVTPKTDSEAIETLILVFKDILGDGSISNDVKDGIGEYFRILANRNLPAFEWLLEAFHVASKKEDHKRNFPYVVGMVRYWMKFGFGHIPAQEEEEVISYFEEVTGVGVTPRSRMLIQNLMATYGSIKVTIMISDLNVNKDISVLMAQLLKEYLDNKYPKKTKQHIAAGEQERSG
ncbi:hypothetical protein IAQ67_28640 (plasmid) [Paenibacillus peoriae]|uniref:Uncharacterized protein n=1 Tax=Paenibacillus peoriae TaxID=59893 RepID=A0A7H0YHC2_9BACL|nr:hypothetical protein [Paenibacillus peoriae]QNR70480.1 hypothetical protein IAQ67_28640 [Paenibacillus peoriae]